MTTYSRNFLTSIPNFDFDKVFEDFIDPERLTKFKIKRSWNRESELFNALQLQPDTAFVYEGCYFWVDKNQYNHTQLRMACPVDVNNEYSFDPSKPGAAPHKYISIDRYNSPFMNWYAKTFPDKYKKDSDYYRKNSSYEHFLSGVIDNLRQKLNVARKARRSYLRTKIAEDPSFAKEVVVVGDIERTQASLAVLKELGELRGIIDSIISGIGKGGVSEATISNYSNLIGTMGSDRRSIVQPLRKHFLKKSKRK